MKGLVGAFNQEKALVGAFSVIVQPVVEPMDLFTALVPSVTLLMLCPARSDRERLEYNKVQVKEEPGVKVEPAAKKQRMMGLGGKNLLQVSICICCLNLCCHHTKPINMIWTLSE